MRLFKLAVGCVAIALLLWNSLFFAWQTLRAVDFGYPILYKVMSLNETIATFGPQNLYKKDFHLTSDEERFRIFSEIVRAIHNHGQGLAQIRYYDPQGREIDKLLRPSEVVHLQDVANLIDRLTTFSLWVLGGMLVFGFVLVKRAIAIRFSVNKVFVVSISACTAATAAVMVIGAEAVFYRWHTWVFPEGHQWFFYYQQSLMTTMMRAPDLFAAIAVLLGLFALGYFYLTLWALKKRLFFVHE